MLANRVKETTATTGSGSFTTAAIAGIVTCIITSVLQCAKFYWDIKHTERRAKPRDDK
jgi:hypothetical protein